MDGHCISPSNGYFTNVTANGSKSVCHMMESLPTGKCSEFVTNDVNLQLAGEHLLVIAPHLY